MSSPRPPRKAVILAAGYGTRMLPLSARTPKPAMPFWNRPVIAHTVDLLRAWGVQEILVNLHAQPWPIIDALRPLAREVRLTYSFEPGILGTGGALRRAAWFLDGQPFWMLNGDVVCDLDPSPLRQAFHLSGLAALWLVPDQGPRTVESRSNLISCFRSARPGTPGTATFSGLQLLSPSVLDYLPESGFATIVDAYERALQAGRRIAGLPVDRSFWADIGTPETYLQAHEDARARRITRLCPGPGPAGAPFRAIAATANVAPTARVTESVVWPGAIVTAGSRVHRAIVGADTIAAGHVRRLALRADHTDDRGVLAVLQRLRWPAGQTTVMPLAPRGSAREFIRLARRSRSMLFVRYSLDRAENALYVGHARFLARLGIRVPRIVLDDPAAHVSVLEDLGDDDLLSLLPSLSPARTEALYRRVLDAVARWHTQSGRAAARARLKLCPGFTPKLFRWEHALFRDHYLQHRLGLDPSRVEAIMGDLGRVARAIQGLPRTLVHRDLQSTNVLIHRGQPAFIDFQGMRMGPAVYDLASLLADPYVMLDESMQARLLAHYASRAPGVPADAPLFWAAAVQRLSQAIGAYARMGRTPATARFAAHIPPALRMIDRALAHLRPLPALSRLVRDELSRLR